MNTRLSNAFMTFLSTPAHLNNKPKGKSHEQH
jgi:hypothetical protein